MAQVSINKLHTLSGHADSVYNLCQGSSEGTFYSSAGDGIVALWNLNDPKDGQMSARVENSVYAIDFNISSNLLAVGHNYDGLHLINVENKEEVASIKLTTEAIFDLKFFGKYVFVGTGDGQIIVVDSEKVASVETIKKSSERVRRLFINEQRGELLAAYSDNFIRVFDLRSLDMKHEFAAHDNSVFSFTISPNGNYLLSVGRDARINVWDIKANYLKVESIVAHMYAINDIAFSPNGGHFVTCSMDKSIKVWDYERMKLIKVIDKSRHAGHGTSVNKLLWTRHNDWLVSCSDDRTISVWDIDIKN
ncbi:MAG: WD40 repeat domain-containing protein [Bacteroidota bacterium]